MGWKDNFKRKPGKKESGPHPDSERANRFVPLGPLLVGTRQRWHQDVQGCREVRSHLETGSPSIEVGHIQALKEVTTGYLRALDSTAVSASAEFDDVLGDLIEEHSRIFPATKDVAVLTCLHILPEHAANRYLRDLANVEAGRYLRCLVLSQHINHTVVPRQNVRVAQSLLGLLEIKQQHLEHFGQLIGILHTTESTPFIPPFFIQSLVERSAIKPYLQKQLDSELDQQRFLGTLGLTSWLQETPGLPTNTSVTNILDAHFPAWKWMIAWKPNRDRIERWERGKFTAAQRRKLSHIFKLDGPDVAQFQYESLRLAEPDCYRGLCIEPLSTAMVETLLDMLHRASGIGPGAIDLFSYLCVDQTFDESAILTLAEALNAGNDSYCCSLLLMLQAIVSKGSLSARMNLLIKALSVLKPKRQPAEAIPQFSNQHFGIHLDAILADAGEKFCSQLKSGAGEYMGTLIYNLGNSILQYPSIHSSLPPDLLPRLRQFPPKDALEAMFEQIRDHDDYSKPEETRFKSYLASTLGGRGDTAQGTITLATIKQEIQFWQRNPDSERVDFAKTLARARNIDYALYSSCLLVMLEEDDLFIRDMRPKITLDNDGSCLNFASYLAHRRQLNQLQHDCWLLILVALLNEQGPTFLPATAKKMGVDKWIELAESLLQLISPVFAKLPHVGAGLSQERFSLWQMLSQNMNSINYLSKMQNGQGNMFWLYFPKSVPQIMSFLDILKLGNDMAPLHHLIVSHLSVDGSNITCVSACIESVEDISAICQAIFKRAFSRLQWKVWSSGSVALSLHNWRRNELLARKDAVAINALSQLLKFPPMSRNLSRPTPDLLRTTCACLKSEYEVLLESAERLETIRLRHHHKDSSKLSVLLQRLGVENSTSGRSIHAEIPSELIDSVEAVSDTAYELAFALTSLNDLQRQARGIPKDARLLLVCVSFENFPTYCIHFPPNDGWGKRHVYHRPTYDGMWTDPCTFKPNVFSFYLASHLNGVFRSRAMPSLQVIHSTTLRLIASSLASCIICSSSMGVKLWKPAVCSKNCSVKLRMSPLEVRLHQLLIDPPTVDLLFTCIYAAAADNTNLTLLPGCPVPKASIRAVIDSFPPLASLQNANNLQSTIRGTDGRGKSREDLLSWLCLKFRGLMLSAPDGFKIPSMPQTTQFLLLNSHHERETLFRQKMGGGAGSGPVFHGTLISRLFLILTDGLKAVSNTTFMAHGAASGAGVYCGDEQSTSSPYAGSTGQSWKHSALSNKTILLGCELAGYISTPVHVITDHDRLLVRYVFLLPAGYTPPPRRHVDTAMSANFSKLRLGVST